MTRSSHPHAWRFTLLRTFLILVCVGIALRLVSIQLLQHSKYETLAARQHTYTREVIAERGKILSADGTELATTQEAYLLFAVPPEVIDAKGVAEELLRLLPFRHKVCVLSKPLTEQDEKCSVKDETEWDDIKKLRTEELRGLLEQKDRLWVPVIRGLSVSEKDLISEKDFPGIYFEQEKKRVYPEGTLAAHVLGFVGSDEFGKPTGYFGIEGYFNGELTGTHGQVHMEVDAEGKPIPIGDFYPIPAKPGLNVTLTIRRELQFILDTLLQEGVEMYKAEYGDYILIDPKTGEIWAMGGAPTYDPGNWIDYLEDETDVARVSVFKDTAISDNYEPGSVMKAFTASVALEQGVVTPDTIYHDEGPLTIQGYQIKTWNNKYSGDITTAQILQLSNNPGAATIGLKIGFPTYWSYLDAMGFGDLLHIELQGEERGLVKPKSTWRDIDLATSSFGQGISVTPLQLTTMMATIANDGVMMKPYIVSSLENTMTQEQVTIKPTVIGQPFSPQTAQTMQSLLRQVVVHGEFQWFVKRQNLENYSIAGKTGTAQIPVPGGYDPNKTNVTFVGFVPEDDPVFVLLVRLNQPKTSTFSADTAVPLWLRMTRELITYFGIPPQ